MLFRFFGLVILGLALSASPALADPPVVESIPVDETLVLPAGTDGNPCAFDVTFDNHGTLRFKTFFDSSGTPIRQIVLSVGFEEKFSANGNEISSISPATAHVDLATNIAVATGNQRHFIVPGVGIVYARAGHVVIDLNNGNVLERSGLDIPAGAGICEALAA